MLMAKAENMSTNISEMISALARRLRRDIFGFFAGVIFLPPKEKPPLDEHSTTSMFQLKYSKQAPGGKTTPAERGGTVCFPDSLWDLGRATSFRQPEANEMGLLAEKKG